MPSVRSISAPASARMAAIFAVLFFFFWASTSTTAAQSAAGDIQGTIVDTAGTVLPGVTVTITNTATNATREAITADEGTFVAPGLPVGPYEVQASRDGFATRRQPNLRLQPGQVITLRLELGVARAPETITVADAPPMVEPTRTQLSSFVTPTEIEHLPVRDRNAVAFALIMPGVMPVNRVLWDGYDGGGPLFAAPTWISQEATQGIRVSTSAYAAEYGRALGGIVEVVTKAGSNETEGSVFGMTGSGANQFGGSAGGPLARNRHFAYGIYDDLRYAPEHDRRLFLAKTDHQLAETHRLSLRYSSRGWRIGQGAGSLADGSSRTFSATATSAIGSTLVNEARVHAGRDREDLLGEADMNRFQVADTLIWVRGAHKVKTGFDMQLDRPYVGEYSLFAQDEWHVDPELTVNLGLRYDAQTFSGLDASAIRSDYNNFGPRLGIAWAPLGRAFVVRGGYGLVYGSTPWPILRSPIIALDTEYRSPRVHQAGTGFEWEWMPNTAISVNYLMIRGDRFPRAAAFSERTTESRYDGLAIEMTRRFAQGHQYRVSYTLAKTDGQMSDIFGTGRHRFAGSVILSSNRFADRFSGVLESVVRDWTLSGIYTGQSGVGSSVPAWVSLDSRIARDIALKRGTRVTVLWEAFNLLDRSNYTFWSPTYDVLTAQLRVDGRRTQVAARLSF
jgi:hypothetical protein